LVDLPQQPAPRRLLPFLEAHAKNARSDEEIDQFLADLRTTCYLLPGVRQAPGAVPADPKDEIIIAAGLESNAGRYPV
jgi:hypothetical protein